MRKRSSYRPRGANPNAWKVGIQGAMRLSLTDQIKTLAKVRDAVEALADCCPSKEAWAHVFDCVNLLEAFSKLRVIKEGGAAYVTELQTLVASALGRQRDTGSNVLRPAEVSALREMVSIYGDVLATCTHRELFEAIERVERKVAQALAMGSHGSVQVLEAA